MNRTMMALASISVAGLAGSAVGQAPRMTAAEGRALYAAGGFPISADGRNPTNRCGAAASPRITFVDMNADGRKEALFIDAGTCYRTDGRWYAVATQAADGSWHRILEGEGSVRATGTAVNGWFVLETTSGGQSRTLIQDGQRYVDRSAAQAPVAAPAAGAAEAPPPAAALAPGADAQRDAAIFRAAGFTRQRAGWESGNCPTPHEISYTPGTIEKMEDINGDGRPEAIVTEGGAMCYGMTGQSFWLLSQQADGGWKVMANDIGIPNFLTTKGAGGFPDIEIGGPGFCFPVVRWNGSSYEDNRFEYEGRRCTPNR